MNVVSVGEIARNEDRTMETPIVARVAEYLRNPEVRKHLQRPVSSQPAVDKVILSDDGLKKYETLSKDLAQAESHWEKERLEHVEHVADQVRLKTYRMTPEVVDQIARRIVALL